MFYYVLFLSLARRWHGGGGTRGLLTRPHSVRYCHRHPHLAARARAAATLVKYLLRTGAPAAACPAVLCSGLDPRPLPLRGVSSEWRGKNDEAKLKEEGGRGTRGEGARSNRIRAESVRTKFSLALPCQRRVAKSRKVEGCRLALREACCRGARGKIEKSA